MAQTKKQNYANESTDPQVRVEILGDRTLVHVGNLGELTRFNEDPTKEPRMSVADVARRVNRPAIEVRRAAREWKERSENFNPFEVWANGIGKGTDFTELYLSRIELLFLITKLRGEVPEKITWDMARTYELAMDGLLGPRIDPVQLSNVLTKLDRLEVRNQEIQIETRQGLMDLARQNQNLQAQIIQLQNSHESGVIGARLAKTEINSPLADYARIMARVDLLQGFRAHCSRAHVELRDELEYPAGQGADWRYLSREKFGKAQRIVRKMLSRAIKALNAIQVVESKKAAARQSSFKYNN